MNKKSRDAASAQAAGRALTFAAMRAMANLDADGGAQLARQADRDTLEWAFHLMTQSYFAAVHMACDEDLTRTRAAITTYVDGCEALEDARAVLETAMGYGVQG